MLLDVGAAWCSWCELIDRESYTRPERAALINSNFVAVKVDYDAQPELVAKLECAEAVLNLPAGLPLTAFVTPTGNLYFGGSYSPREASRDKDAFEDVLKQVLLMYREQRGDYERHAFSL